MIHQIYEWIYGYSLNSPEMVVYVNKGIKKNYKDIVQQLCLYSSLIKTNVVTSPVLLLYDNLFDASMMILELLRNNHQIICVHKNYFTAVHNRNLYTQVDTTVMPPQISCAGMEGELFLNEPGLLFSSPFDGHITDGIEISNLYGYWNKLDELNRRHTISTLYISDYFGDCEAMCILLFTLSRQIVMRNNMELSREKDERSALFIPVLEFRHAMESKSPAVLWVLHGFLGDAVEYEELHHISNTAIYTQMPFRPQGDFLFHDHQQSDPLIFDECLFHLKIDKESHQDKGILYYRAPLWWKDEKETLPSHIGNYRKTDLVCRCHNDQFQYVNRLGDLIKYYGVDLDLSLMGDLFCTIYGVKQCCLRFVYNDRNMPELFCYYTSTEAIEDTLRVRQEAEGLFFNILPSENIILLKEMPLDMHRKVDRSKLPDPYALRDSRNVAIHPATLHALSKYLKEQAGMEISDVANDDLMVTFDDLQINSIAFIDMILFIEKELNIRIPDTMLDKALFENINSFLSYLSTLFSSEQSNE